jgi:hypothetical protein
VHYTDSISDFFKSPKWMMNLLLGGVCVLIPIVGPMVVLGWLITGFWARQDENFATFPDFDFSHFGKYLERGLWPFLVAFVVSSVFSIVLVPLIWLFMIPMMVVGGMSSGHEANAGTCFGAVAMIVMILMVMVLVFALMLLLVPLKIRASLTQDFAKSFDFGFVKRFLALTWKETLLSSLFVMIAGSLLICLGMFVLCVGMYFATVVVYFSWTHLHKQLYALYVSRGGEPVPLSPKLIDGPPAMPGV